jgi:tetratricopeptide (TPR) repeat protein
LIFVIAADPAIYFDAQASTLTRVARHPSELAAARRALDEHNYARARQQAARATQLRPDDGEAWLVLGLSLFHADRPAEALPVFERASQLLPRSATARFNLGSAEYQTGRYAEAAQSYHAAADLDAKVRPLALLRAGQSALDGGRLDAAERDLNEARSLAGSGPIAEDASELLHELAEQRDQRFSTVFKEAHAGKLALDQKRVDEALAHYLSAVTLASHLGAPVRDRAELEYGLGHALLQKNDLTGARRAFELAAELLPKDPAIHFMLAVVQLRDGEEQGAKATFEETLALHPSAEDAELARGYLAQIARRMQPSDPRFLLELRAGGGFDSNVPESGILITAFHGPDRGAPMLTADVDAFVRIAGGARGALLADYRFAQLAYLSKQLDSYSLQEHDLQAILKWSATRWLTGEALLDGYVLASGLEKYSAFQYGLSLGPRLLFREWRGLELRVKYQHVFKSSLDRFYRYLGGDRDEISAAEEWHNERARLILAYRFTREAVGVQDIGGGVLSYPTRIPHDHYHIPFSYRGSEVSLTAAADLFWKLRATITQRYEHRNYPQPSYIYNTLSKATSYQRLRLDNRYTLEATIRRPLWGSLNAELAYALVVNRSTIDNTRASTIDDYDNENYLKHVLELQLSFMF